MSFEHVHAKITAKAWQSIAQSQMDLSALSREDMNKLVELIVEATLEGVDDYLAEAVPQTQADSKPAPPTEADSAAEGGDDGEEILWEGRPFLSIATHYTITNQRLRITEGLLGKSREDIELVRIQDIDQTQSFTERTLRLGDLHIASHDPSHPQITLNNIRNPEAVHEILRRAVNIARQKYRLSFREEM